MEKRTRKIAELIPGIVVRPDKRIDPTDKWVGMADHTQFDVVLGEGLPTILGSLDIPINSYRRSSDRIYASIYSYQEYNNKNMRVGDESLEISVSLDKTDAKIAQEIHRRLIKLNYDTIVKFAHALAASIQSENSRKQLRDRLLEIPGMRATTYNDDLYLNGMKLSYYRDTISLNPWISGLSVEQLIRLNDLLQTFEHENNKYNEE